MMTSPQPPHPLDYHALRASTPPEADWNGYTVMLAIATLAAIDLLQFSVRFGLADSGTSRGEIAVSRSINVTAMEGTITLVGVICGAVASIQCLRGKLGRSRWIRYGIWASTLFCAITILLFVKWRIFFWI